MMTERVDPTQLKNMQELVKEGNKALQDALKQMKGLNDTITQLKTDVVAAKRGANEVRDALAAFKKLKSGA